MGVRLVADHGQAIDLFRLTDYCMLHYRIPKEQAEALIAEGARQGMLAIKDGMVQYIDPSALQPSPAPDEDP